MFALYGRAISKTAPGPFGKAPQGHLEAHSRAHLFTVVSAFVVAEGCFATGLVYWDNHFFTCSWDYIA